MSNNVRYTPMALSLNRRKTSDRSLPTPPVRLVSSQSQGKMLMPHHVYSSLGKRKLDLLPLSLTRAQAPTMALSRMSNPVLPSYGADQMLVPGLWPVDNGELRHEALTRTVWAAEPLWREDMLQILNGITAMIHWLSIVANLAEMPP